MSDMYLENSDALLDLGDKLLSSGSMLSLFGQIYDGNGLDFSYVLILYS